MGLFNRKQLTSDEYTDLSSKIVKLSTDVAILQGTLEKIETRFKALHTKIARIKDYDDDDNNDQMTPQDIQRGLLGLG